MPPGRCRTVRYDSSTMVGEGGLLGGVVLTSHLIYSNVVLNCTSRGPPHISHLFPWGRPNTQRPLSQVAQWRKLVCIVLKPDYNNDLTALIITSMRIQKCFICLLKKIKKSRALHRINKYILVLFDTSRTWRYFCNASWEQRGHNRESKCFKSHYFDDASRIFGRSGAPASGFCSLPKAVEVK